MFDSNVIDYKGEDFLQKPLNEMKFSFNKNNAFPISNEPNNSSYIANKSSTIK